MDLGKLIKISSSIFECLHDGVAVVDKHETIIYVNGANFRITGQSKSELLGKNVKDAVPNSNIPFVLQNGSELIGIKTEVNSKSVISNIVPIIIDNKIEGVISIFRDITEVLALNKKLDEANLTIEHLYKKLNYIGNIVKDIVVGKNVEMNNVASLVQKATQVTSPILFEGEQGTGKEMLARLIHQNSQRGDKPFIAVNCSTKQESHLELELFGYEEGSFNTARKGGRPGIFEMVNGGTIFLDEINEMSNKLQIKLLRVLQNMEVLRIGGVIHRPINVRIIAASDSNISNLVKEKNFNQELLNKLGVIKISLPTLFDRKEDLHLYIDNALRKVGLRIGKSVKSISLSALSLLMEYEYPGNIRELENIIETAIVSDDDNILNINDLPPYLKRMTKLELDEDKDEINLKYKHFPTASEIERGLLEVALRKFRSKAAIAKNLNISRSTLYRKLEEYGITDKIE